MGGLPPPAQVAGSQIGIYESWFHYIDPTESSCIGALVAASFLKKSGLSSSVLSQIWDLSDPFGRGYLDKPGFFVALKLVAVTQAGLEVSLANVNKELPPPNMGEEPPTRKTPVPSQGSLGSVGSLLSPTGSLTSQTPRQDWSVSSEEKMKYDSLFETLEPSGGKVGGAKVREVMMNSKLPVDILGRVWEMADMDADGALTRHEFVVAMHLVKKLLDGYNLPPTLPNELARPTPAMWGAVPVLPKAPSLSGDLHKIGTLAPVMSPVVPWVVKPAEREKAEALFVQADNDRDGFVSGGEIRDVFLQSGLPQPVLAHLWNLCDIKQTGKLNVEQFALALWLVNQKRSGFEFPPALTPEMVPPSFRTPEAATKTTPYSNPEIEKLTKELAQMAAESRALETDIAANEADIRLRNAEVRSMTTELETLTATLKQLENQKREAQKRLDDMDTQILELRTQFGELAGQVFMEEQMVVQLRSQAEEQEARIKSQEEEVSAKKNELQTLRNEEQTLENQLKTSTKQMEVLEKSLLDTQLSISQVKVNVGELQEHMMQVAGNAEVFDSAIAMSDASSVSEIALRPVSPPSFVLSELKSPVTPITNGFAASFEDSAFGGPVTASRSAHSFDADPFMAAFGTTIEKSPVDGFVASFGDNQWNDRVDTSASDPFGSEPFGTPKSSGPALPPKKAKQPPPRPAPPKATGKIGPPRPTPPPVKSPSEAFAAFDSDPFAGPAPPSSGNNGFADFADFGSKFGFESSDPWGQSSVNSSQNINRYAEMEFKEDPFKDMRYEDPFGPDPFSGPKKDPFSAPKKDPFSAKQQDNFEDPFGFGAKSPVAPEKSDFANFGAFDDPFANSSGASDPFRSKSPWSDGFGDSFSNNNNTISGKKSPKKDSISKIIGKAFSPTTEKKSKKLAKSTSSLSDLDVAKQESIRLEVQRRQRIEEQEKADLELALALSRLETSSGKAAAVATPLANDRLI